MASLNYGDGMGYARYDVTYHLVRRRMIEDTYTKENTRDKFLRALDAAYSERHPFPFSIIFYYGDPLADTTSFNGLGKKIPKKLKRVKKIRWNKGGKNGMGGVQET